MSIIFIYSVTVSHDALQWLIFLRWIFSLLKGTSGVLLRKVNGTAIVQLPSKQQVQVSLPGLRLRIKLYSDLNWKWNWKRLCTHTHTHRSWRRAWWRWDGCPTLTTIKRSSAKPDAIAGSASGPRAACGRGREAGLDARSNLCLRWRVTSTCPPSLLNNATGDMLGTGDMLHAQIAAERRRKEEK